MATTPVPIGISRRAWLPTRRIRARQGELDWEPLEGAERVSVTGVAGVIAGDWVGRKRGSSVLFMGDYAGSDEWQ
ncbi:MAG: hypothetical protein HC802_21505 [Caldilineaceae bacterium]|nr:hypothetical protein [Caldilineaceae bacterium]